MPGQVAGRVHRHGLPQPPAGVEQVAVHLVGDQHPAPSALRHGLGEGADLGPRPEPAGRVVRAAQHDRAGPPPGELPGRQPVSAAGPGLLQHQRHLLVRHAGRPADRREAAPLGGGEQHRPGRGERLQQQPDRRARAEGKQHHPRRVDGHTVPRAVPVRDEIPPARVADRVPVRTVRRPGGEGPGDGGRAGQVHVGQPQHDHAGPPGGLGPGPLAAARTGPVERPVERRRVEEPVEGGRVEGQAAGGRDGGGRGVEGVQLGPPVRGRGRGRGGAVRCHANAGHPWRAGSTRLRGRWVSRRRRGGRAGPVRRRASWRRGWRGRPAGRGSRGAAARVFRAGPPPRTAPGCRRPTA